jgi:hypothetical protein
LGFLGVENGLPFFFKKNVMVFKENMDYPLFEILIKIVDYPLLILMLQLTCFCSYVYVKISGCFDGGGICCFETHVIGKLIIS